MLTRTPGPKSAHDGIKWLSSYELEPRIPQMANQKERYIVLASHDSDPIHTRQGTPTSVGTHQINQPERERLVWKFSLPPPPAKNTEILPISLEVSVNASKVSTIETSGKQ